MTETVYDDGAAVELSRWFRDAAAGGPTQRLRLTLVTLDERADMLAGRRRQRPLASRLPRREDDRDAVRMVGPEGPDRLGATAHRAWTSTAWWSARSASTARPRSATASRRREVGYGLVEARAAHGARAPRRCVACSLETDRHRRPGAAGVQPRQRRQPPGARRRAASPQLRGTDDEGQLVMAPPAAPRMSPPPARRDRPRRHPRPLRRHRLAVHPTT